MVSEELALRRKMMKTGALIVAFCYFIGNWIATQLVARACNYNELLGRNLSLGDVHIYPPYKFYMWMQDDLMIQAIPHILAEYNRIVYIAVVIGMVFSYFITKGMKKNITHGSASFATANDIEAAGLSKYTFEKFKKGNRIVTKKIIKNSGVVVGINPFDGKLMLHDGPEHMLLMAPTRSGKGVNTIIPTGLIWRHSIFFFDVKSELWQATAAYRRDVLGQKVMKFEPLCTDGSTARWNPLAEINFRTLEEFNDVQSIVAVLIAPDSGNKGGDPFWDDAMAALLKGTILHLLYQHYQEKRPIPSLTDMMSFLSSPDKETEELFESMRDYPHISKEEFLELEYVDTEGNKQHHVNALKEIYGEYIRDFTAFNTALHCNVHTLDALKDIIKTRDTVDFTEEPFSMLLTHPKVAEGAANMLHTAANTRASIMMTAQTNLALYQNPVIQRNTAVSDFFIKDLLDPAQAISMYLVMQVDDVSTIKPLSRLFINMMLSKLIRDLKFEKDTNAVVRKQRLLLMLDEFPQLGCLKKLELALAVCAGYGIKVCVVSQDVNQLNSAYTKDNSIASNCHVHIYFTPNLDTTGATAAAISKSLGKETIETNSHSDGGGGMFKGSMSTSYTGRDLMTPDEVAHMSYDKELVFVAGQKPILGRKLKYYEEPFFMKKILPEPLFSDEGTSIISFDDLFRVHAAESKARMERKFLVDEAKLTAKMLKKEEILNESTVETEEIVQFEKIEKPQQSELTNLNKSNQGPWIESSSEVKEYAEIEPNEDNSSKSDAAVTSIMQQYMYKKEENDEAQQ